MFLGSYLKNYTLSIISIYLPVYLSIIIIIVSLPLDKLLQMLGKIRRKLHFYLLQED